MSTKDIEAMMKAHNAQFEKEFGGMTDADLLKELGE